MSVCPKTRSVRIGQRCVRRPPSLRAAFGLYGIPMERKPLPCLVLVGAPGLEPGTFCSQSRRATKLRYAPSASMLSCAPPFCKESAHGPVNVARPPISHARSAGVPHDPLTPSERLARLAEGYLTSLYDSYPTTAASLGLHDYDGRIPDIRDDARAVRAAALRAFRTQLAGLPPQLLDVEDAHDHTLLSLALDEELFELEQLREFERNPMAFSGPLDVS